MEDKERKELLKCIKRLKAKINYLERKNQNKEEYISELENIEENRLILFLRAIKEKEIIDFHYSCNRTKTEKGFENSLEYNIYVKRKYEGSEE